MEASANIGIQRHRRAFGRIKLAVRLVLHELSVAGDRDHGAGHAFGGDLAGEKIVQARESLLRKSDVVRLCLGQRRGIRRIGSDAGNDIAAAIMNGFIVFSLACGSGRTIIMVRLSCLDHVCKGDKPSVGAGHSCGRRDGRNMLCVAGGQITQKPVQPFAQKYSAFVLAQISRITPLVSRRMRGARERHERAVRCDGR